MNRATLTRQVFSSQGTFGVLAIDQQNFFTGELPWIDNLRGRSCIPLGTYEVSWTFSPRFKRYCYEVMDVPGRDGIRFHAGNFCGDREKGWKSDVDGCIILGESFGAKDGQKCLFLSVRAINRFEAYMAQEDFVLTIE